MGLQGEVGLGIGENSDKSYILPLAHPGSGESFLHMGIVGRSDALPLLALQA